MKNLKGWIFTWLLNIVALAYIYNISIQPEQVQEVRGGGMGKVELTVGCGDYFEFGVINDMLYDSIVIQVTRDCNMRPNTRI